MPYVKKLVMHGFKSFATRTEILFENAMNVIVGPNGSGKSNITDALCFVLGRLSIKSIRAAKAANLLFSGNKAHKPANEASVELIFDNADRGFGIDTAEVAIKRIVRRNGLSIYKINNEVKTRQELLELLAMAGIDPNGFNIVLQGEIASFVKLHPEERRKVIEEVAGISIYETRKEKSLKELEKTDEKLKEVASILRERAAYLRNLDKERQEALNFQKLDEVIKRCKATILSKGINEKEKEMDKINLVILEQNKEIDKIKKLINEKNFRITELEDKLKNINRLIQSSTSDEQETLHREIADLKARLAAFGVRKENFELRLEESRRKKAESEGKLKLLEKEISQARSVNPEQKKQQSQAKEIQERFDNLERERRKFYLVRSELSTLESKKAEREKSLIEYKKEVEFVERGINSLFEEIKYAKSAEKSVLLRQEVKEDVDRIKNQIVDLEKREVELERENAVIFSVFSREERLKLDIVKLDVCPLCQSRITKEHIDHVILESNRKLDDAGKRQKKNEEEKLANEDKIKKLKDELVMLQAKLSEIEVDIVKIRNAEDKKNQIKRISEEQEKTKAELKDLIEKVFVSRKEFERLKNVEEHYDEARLRLQELNFTDLDLDSEITMKSREVNRISTEAKAFGRDIEESQNELKGIIEGLLENQRLVEKKEKEETQLYEKFQRLFNDRNGIQDTQKAIETEIIGLQHNIRAKEDKINALKIEKAKYEAEGDSLKFEFKQYESFELMQGSLDEIKERFMKAQEKISQVGSVNMRALEAFEKVKEQCMQIEEKVKTIEKEKIQIQKIIEEIDKKKRKSFYKTLEAVNALFTRNFSQLSKKGEVFLELENKDDPFSAGLTIIVRVARGKYFDVTSLSGGEQTLVALSLIFAIQEYKPYCFYVFDEIDAALDKHNSERLASLIRQYMTTGEYIVVTHNDALITAATTLYGVSMQENISKVISLKV